MYTVPRTRKWEPAGDALEAWHESRQFGARAKASIRAYDSLVLGKQEAWAFRTGRAIHNQVHIMLSFWRSIDSGFIHSPPGLV